METGKRYRIIEDWSQGAPAPPPQGTPPQVPPLPSHIRHILDPEGPWIYLPREVESQYSTSLFPGSEEITAEKIDPSVLGPTPDKAMKEKYFESEGTVCPFCGFDQTEGGSISIEGNNAFQDMGCLNCEKQWRDVWARHSFYEITDEP